VVSPLPDQSEREGRTAANHFSLSGGEKGAMYNQFSGVAKALKKKDNRNMRQAIFFGASYTGSTSYSTVPFSALTCL